MNEHECNSAKRAWNPLRSRSRIAACIAGAAAALAVPATASAQVGLEDLIARIGERNVPTGKGVIIAQVEAHNANNNYRPALSNAEFTGKTFTLMSGPSGSSNHATLVGLQFYGLETSVAPAIDEIFCYSASGWLGSDLLNTALDSNVQPLAGVPGMSIYNNSWIASGGASNDAARRADFVVRRDNVLIISGVNNGEPQFPLMMTQFNGISVGRSQGGHASSDTPATFDVPGRMKPELVTPGSATSFSTGLASSAAALMVETARTPPLDQNPLAERSEVLKAVLLGGAKRDFPGANWTNNPEQSGGLRGLTLRPLDEVFGAGEANVNRSHLILTGKQYEGMPEPPDGAHLCRAGWDLAPLGGFQKRYWRFRLPQPSQTVTVVATWHRVVNPNNMGVWVAGNMDLRLWRVDAQGELQTLIGDSGVPFFSGGNVASHSPVDNVELLYVHELAAGDYVIELERIDGAGPIDIAVAWLMDSAVRHGDINDNGSVGVADLLLLLGGWGPCDDGLPGCTGDLNCDGTVGVADLLLLLSQWG